MSNYKDGAKAEFVVAEMLKSDGWHIAYASNLDGIAGGDGAPLVRGGDDRKIMPDIHAMKDGRTLWVEVKLKRSGAEWIHKNEQYEHFIDGSNWKSYLFYRMRKSSTPPHSIHVWLAQLRGAHDPGHSPSPLLMPMPISRCCHASLSLLSLFLILVLSRRTNHTGTCVC